MIENQNSASIQLGQNRRERERGFYKSAPPTTAQALVRRPPAELQRERERSAALADVREAQSRLRAIEGKQ